MSECVPRIQQARLNLQSSLGQSSRPNSTSREHLYDVKCATSRGAYPSYSIGSSIIAEPSFTLSKTRYKYPVVERLLYTSNYSAKSVPVCGNISAENTPLKRHSFTTIQHPHPHRNAQHTFQHPHRSAQHTLQHPHRNAQHTLQHPHRSAQHTLQRKSSHSAQNQRVLTMSELHQMLKKQRSGERDPKLQICIDRTTKRSISGKASYPAVTLTIKPSNNEAEYVRNLLLKTSGGRSVKPQPDMDFRKPREFNDVSPCSDDEEELPSIQNASSTTTPRLTEKYLKRLEAEHSRTSERTEQWLRENPVSAMLHDEQCAMMTSSNMSDLYDETLDPHKLTDYKQIKRVRFKDRYEKTSFTLIGQQL